MYSVHYTKTAIKSLRKIPADYRQRIVSEIAAIATDPAVYRGDWKTMLGAPYWRLRVGSYRVICDVQNETLILLVVKVGSRGDVYK
jgi:mRNA interferase RelE/StbE